MSRKKWRVSSIAGWTTREPTLLNKSLEVNDQSIQIDQEGYLLEPSDWYKDVAQVIADKEGIELTKEAREAIMFVREHFESYQCIPEHRKLLQALRKKHD